MTETIASLQNPRIKAAIRLRARRGRKQSDRILIDGIREVTRALEAGVAVQELFVCRPVLPATGADKHVRSHQDWQSLLEKAQQVRVRMTEVTESVFTKIGYGQRADGVVAVAKRPRYNLDDLSIGHAALVTVLERIEKPGNLGAILRSADAAGVDAVIAIDPATDVYGPNVIRSSAGAAFCVPLVETVATHAMDWLQQGHYRIIAASPNAHAIFTDLDYRGPTAIMLGAESQGLGNEWTECDVTHAAVPMSGRSDSLNVSTTAALFFYEALRQRRQAAPDP